MGPTTAIESCATKAYIFRNNGVHTGAAISASPTRCVFQPRWLTVQRSRRRHQGRYLLQSQIHFRLNRALRFLAWALVSAGTVVAQNAPEGNSSPSPAGASSAPTGQEQKSAEVATRDTPAMFKVRVNLVLVRVVVRDQQGNVVENLHREDFALADNRKPQVISSFNIETPAARVRPGMAAETVSSGADGTPRASAGPMPAIPQRFVSILYDDVHMSMQDAVTARDATTRLFAALAPTDRVGIFTTSGQTTEDFTSNQEAIKRTLNGLAPKSLFAQDSGASECPEISYYQADLIENKNDLQAMDVATLETVDCAFNGDMSKIALARPIAAGAAQRAL